MKAVCRTLLPLLVITAGQAWSATAVGLREYVFNLNGSGTAYGIYGSLPAAMFDTSAFDFGTGVGTVKITYKPGAAGTYFVSAYFDHDLDALINSSFNEMGALSGALPAGYSYQLDDPFNGDIFPNATAATNMLDNTNHVATPALPPNACCDVSMALARTFALSTDDTAIVRFTISQTAPASGFYLIQSDPDSMTLGANDARLFLSSDLAIQPGQGGGGGDVPEPGSLGFVSLAAIAGYCWRRVGKASVAS